jgi:hypothetical protein
MVCGLCISAQAQVSSTLDFCLGFHISQSSYRIAKPVPPYIKSPLKPFLISVENAKMLGTVLRDKVEKRNGVRGAGGKGGREEGGRGKEAGTDMFLSSKTKKQTLNVTALHISFLSA